MKALKQCWITLVTHTVVHTYSQLRGFFAQRYQNVLFWPDITETLCLRTPSQADQQSPNPKFFFWFFFFFACSVKGQQTLDASPIISCACVCVHFWITRTTCGINLRQMLVLGKHCVPECGPRERGITDGGDGWSDRKWRSWKRGKRVHMAARD